MKTEKQIINLIVQELRRAEKLHPDYPNDLFRQVTIINEEAGEVARAVLHYHYEDGVMEDVIKELIQTAAMCIRMLNQIPLI